jgi:hypothetical protein
LERVEIDGLLKAFPNGVSEAFLVRGSDGNNYAAKFQEKAENGARGQGREVIAGVLAPQIGVQVPETAVLVLTQQLIDNEPALTFKDGSRPQPGLASGSAFRPPIDDPTLETTARLALCPSIDAAGILVFNTWVASGDRHWDNYAFYRTDESVRLASIDYASAFQRAPGDPLRPLDAAEVQTVAHNNPTIVLDFVERLEALSDADIERAVAAAPDEMLDEQERRLISDQLMAGRGLIRAAVGSFLP